VAQDGWQARLTGVVAREVRRYRTDRRISAQQLADRCEQLGLPIPRPVLSNLENNRRESVTLAELLVLAEALEVAPLLLAIPLGRQQAVEFLPGQEVPTWEAALWWRGEGEAIKDLGRGPELVRSPGQKNPADLVLEHQDLVSRWRRDVALARDAAFAAERAAPEERPGWIAAAEAHRENRARSESSLAEKRSAMRGLGLIPPPLPTVLAHLERSAPEHEAELEAGG
jgi:transcriptional regulator with XRE-family HTH domain